MAAINKRVEVDEKKEALINLAYAMEAAKARGDMKEAALIKTLIEDANKEMAEKIDEISRQRIERRNKANVEGLLKLYPTPENK